MADQPAGPLLNALGVQIDVEDGDQITEVLVIAKIANFDTGDTGLSMGASNGLDWIAQLGLLSAATMLCGRGDIGE